MSLATRCNACGTMFRVVQDQLRVSEGWVRCGRCDTVFNALDALVDLAADAVAPPPPARRSGEDAALDVTIDDRPNRPDAADSGPLGDRPAPMRSAAAPREEPPPAPATDLPPMVASLDATAPAAPAPVWRPEREDASPPPPAEAAGTAGSAGAVPSFMQNTGRPQAATSPAMRAALVGGALILAGLLAAQATYHFRDAVAARSPTADAWLRSACARWGCTIEAPRRIDQVTLEGSGLSRLPDQPQAVKLSINLRNRGQTDLMLPSVDLSLTDARGELIARRVLAPKDFLIDPPRIRRGTELPLELVLSSGDRVIAGYTVELFYP